jgi:hypothetical protein
MARSLTKRTSLTSTSPMALHRSRLVRLALRPVEGVRVVLVGRAAIAIAAAVGVVVQVQVDEDRLPEASLIRGFNLKCRRPSWKRDGLFVY